MCSLDCFCSFSTIFHKQIFGRNLAAPVATVRSRSLIRFEVRSRSCIIGSSQRHRLHDKELPCRKIITMVVESQTAGPCSEGDDAGKCCFPDLPFSKREGLPAARRAVDGFNILCRPTSIQNSVVHRLMVADLPPLF